MGPKQRCWTHLLRDIRKLVEKDASVAEWADRVADIYKAAKKAARRRIDKASRVLLREDLQDRLLAIVEPYLHDKGNAQHVLSKRICQYMPELFTFVECPSVSSSNNAAERAIRPAVISRKISGGTRSAKGSQVKTRLMSIFATRALEGKEPIAACAQMIVNAQKTPQICAQ